MNLTQVMHGEHLTAEWFKYNHESKEYFTKKVFKYKTYDDAQLYERRMHPQAGNLSSKYSLSIKTTSDFDFRVKDKIRLIDDDRTYEVTGVQRLKNTPLVLLNALLPRAKGNVPTLIHLNKDDV